jgi:SAM-dependent methyltransferase
MDSQKKWNDRYGSEDYFFGKEPNEFLKNKIEEIPPGKALFIGDGEGRNSVYAAKKGWNVISLDISDVAKTKAKKLADENNVQLEYIVCDALDYDFPVEKFDLVAIIYFHVETERRMDFDQNIIRSLKPNGKIILLVYEEDNLSDGDGGPSDKNLLYNLSDIAENYIDLEFNTFLKEQLSRVKKGRQQDSVVIKFVGTKL